MQIKLTRWFVYEWSKSTWQKPYRMILKSSLPRIHYYHNKWLQVKEFQYLIPTYNWTLTSIPNWTGSVVIISHFQYTAPSTWLTNKCVDPNTWLNHQIEKDFGCKVIQFIIWWKSRNSLVTKPYDIQTQQLLQEKDELGQILSPVTLTQPLTSLKIILIYV